MEIDLLDYLSLRCGCMFLSDLRFVHSDPEKTRALCVCVCHMPPNECTLHEWNDAASYITGKNVSFLNESAAKEYLLCYLHMGVLRTTMCDPR